jgi:hypothetical protein
LVTKIVANRKLILSALVISLLIVLQMVRIVVFVNEYGGVEHDGGWALGISRSVAERGVYTSLTSTVVDPSVQTGLNYDDQFTIQDEMGREYFFVAHTTGPGVVLPNALVFKMFGVSFWSSRLASLIFFFLFLVLTAAILYFLQGLMSIIVFHLYLFFFPQLYISLGYEAFGEMPSMVYGLTSFILFVYATQTGKRPLVWYFASGVLAGIAMNTRLATVIIFCGLGVVWLILFWQKKTTLKSALAVISGALLVAVLWQLIVLVSLMRVSNLLIYSNHVWGRIDFFLRTVKGITPVAEGVELFLLKAIIISELSYSHLLVSLLLFVTTAICGVLLIKYLQGDSARQNMIIILWTAWLVYTIWFLNGPKNAWVRYYWYGIVWMVMILGATFGVFIRQIKERPNVLNISGSLFLALLFAFSFGQQPQALNVFITPELIEVWRQRQLTTRDTYLPWIIVSRREQAEVAEFILNLPPEANIYYPEGHKTAELSFLTNRVFYTLPRRILMGTNPQDVVIMGPAIISPWKKEQQQRLDILETIHRECPSIIWESPNYIICAAE